MPKLWLLAAVLLFVAPCAHAQFGWDDEPEQTAATDSFDAFDTVLRTPVIEPIRPIRPVIEPIVPVFQPFVAPMVDADPLVEQCGLEPQVAQVYRAAEIVEDESDCPEFLGRLSANPYASDSTANPYSAAGSPYSARSVNNPFGPYGSPYSSTSARNPYATDAPKIVAQDGTYLGELSDNPYDPDSVANPYGRYGSPYSSTSIKNPYSTYGSPYSSQSPNNPYATQAPLLFGDWPNNISGRGPLATAGPKAALAVVRCRFTTTHKGDITMKRDTWTFRYTAQQLADATRTKIEYHNKCLEFWESRREQLIAEIRADGIEVNEKTVLQTPERMNIKGRDWTTGGDVMIRNDLRKSLAESYEKLSYHTSRRDQYKGWLQAFTDNLENSHELEMDDWQFFFGKDTDPA